MRTTSSREARRCVEEEVVQPRLMPMLRKEASCRGTEDVTTEDTAWRAKLTMRKVWLGEVRRHTEEEEGGGEG